MVNITAIIHYDDIGCDHKRISYNFSYKNMGILSLFVSEHSEHTPVVLIPHTLQCPCMDWDFSVPYLANSRLLWE